MKRNIRWVTWLVMLLIGVTLWSAPAQARILVAGEDEKTQTAVMYREKKGNCDDFIGLKSSKWLVLATGKKYIHVYKKRSETSKELGHFKKNNCIVVATELMKKGKDYSWIPVRLTGGRIGYVPYKKVSLGKLDIKTFGLNVSEDARNRTRIKICKFGLPYLGTKFKLGGASLTAGIDCSTFLKKAMHNAGVSCYGLAVDLSWQGTSITRDQLKPGDTLYYPHDSKDLSIGHCAIYLGGDGCEPGEGYIINASGHQGSTYPAGGIRISRIDYRKPTAVRFRNFVGN